MDFGTLQYHQRYGHGIYIYMHTVIGWYIVGPMYRHIAIIIMSLPSALGTPVGMQMGQEQAGCVLT